MKKLLLAHSRKLTAVCGLLLLLDAPRPMLGEPSPAALAAFDRYCKTVEARLAQQHRSTSAFLAPAGPGPEDPNARLRDGQPPRDGQPVITRLTPATGEEFPGAMLHHWRGTAFVPGATAAQFTQLLRDVNAYPRIFAPQVLQARVLAQSGDAMQAGDQMQISMRVRQRHVITVVLDTTYAIGFGELDPRHGYSVSRSTRIAEIASPGTPAEHTLSPAEEHGFLYRLNTYWSYEERDGGLYLQIETVSLSRAVPSGLGWAVRPYVESIPRESLEFTLRAACAALRK